ncbi:uncharacterized protein LOC118743651 [Rhagoletis pomonella]|uniref:uncharacterized protein LOC118743651 n=1 Tax=Rhagoletis pomonella TaxID=28610 RepID=UPI00177F12A3|nr:uncharacterized protein LOC118743651 [Rhagoletis pomonella]
MEPNVAETPQLVKVKLLPALKPEERKRHIVANIVLEGQTSTVPYIDDANSVINVTQLQALDATPPGKDARKRIRFYSVGPRTYHTKCPLCLQYGDAAVMRAAGLKDATCCLSTLSCFFPIFWLCCICTWCGCNREWTTKGIYCSKCGAKLGIQQRPK